jgi:cytoskeleton protein RodZ
MPPQQTGPAAQPAPDAQGATQSMPPAPSPGLTTDTAPSPPSSTVEQPGTSEQAGPAAQPPSADAAKTAQVRLVFEGESWVEIRDGNGDVIFSRLNAAGTERTVRGSRPLTVVVGNAPQVKLVYKDEPVDLAQHTRVDVARITLD